MTPIAARDEMLAVFLSAWIAQGLDPARIVWDDKPGSVPDGELAWARVTTKHDAGPVLGFGTTGARYSNMGTLWIQLFTPFAGANVQALVLAHAVVTAYRRASNGGVWFRNTRFKEVGISGAFEQTNVLTDFSYDD